MAEAVLRRIGAEHGIEVLSAGTGAVAGLPLAEEAVRVLARRGLALEGHASRPLTEELLEWADHVLAMERHHKRVVERMRAAEKVTLISEYGGDGGDVRDPIGLGEEAYEDVLSQLERYLSAFVATELAPERRPKETSRGG